jgi:hypothetical protein
VSEVIVLGRPMESEVTVPGKSLVMQRLGLKMAKVVFSPQEPSGFVPPPPHEAPQTIKRQDIHCLKEFYMNPMIH